MIKPLSAPSAPIEPLTVTFGSPDQLWTVFSPASTENTGTSKDIGLKRITGHLCRVAEFDDRVHANVEGVAIALDTAVKTVPDGEIHTHVFFGKGSTLPDPKLLDTIINSHSYLLTWRVVTGDVALVKLGGMSFLEIRNARLQEPKMNSTPSTVA